MHWTSYLAYRRVYHPDAQIVGDLGCVGCGYNLRGLRAMGNCPECGAAVADSLYVLARPAIVAESLRSFANSYGTFFILVIGCLGAFQGWQLLATLLVLAGGTLYRLCWTSNVHFRAELMNSAQLSSRARWWWFASIVELVAAAIWMLAVITILSIATPTAASAQFVVYVGLGWLAAALVNALFAGLFGLALATILGYGWMVVEFRLQAIAVAAALISGPLLAILIKGNVNMALGIAMAFVAGLALLIAFFMTWLGLHHASNGAERATDTADDVQATL